MLTPNPHIRRARMYAAIFVTGCVLAIVLVMSRDRAPAIVQLAHVSGPAAPTIMPQPAAARWQDFNGGADSRLAVLLTETDSAWLGLAHGLKSIGVPFIITQDVREALRHKVVYIYPWISGKNMTPEGFKALARFPDRGGTLIAQHVLGGGLQDVFGFDEALPTATNSELRLVRPPAAAELTDDAEKTIRIGGPVIGTVGAYAYTRPHHPPVAVYEDGRAAIIRNAPGSAYAFGIDVGYLLLRGYNNRQQDIAAHYVNAYEPTLDVLLRLIKAIYLAGEKSGVTLATVPEGKSLAVLLTHDIDYTRSVENALAYAEFEHQNGIAATYFMQTKYVRDWNDDVFFTENNFKKLRRLHALGMEIGSHTVAHSKICKDFPLGDGGEQYPAYKPFVKSRYAAEGGSILGELRVSKFLLEHAVPGLKVTSFRPGHLSNPRALPQALAATGYRFSASVTADDSLTHLPFRLDYSRGAKAETTIYEFPLTVSDEADTPVTNDRMIDRLPQAIALAEKLKRYGGLFTILIHPDMLGHKLDFEKKFVAAMGDTVWYGTVGQFGAWWAARDKIDVDVANTPGGMTVALSAPEEISGLAFDIPPDMVLASSGPGLQAVQYGRRVVIERFSGKARLAFRRGQPWQAARQEPVSGDHQSGR